MEVLTWRSRLRAARRSLSAFFLAADPFAKQVIPYRKPDGTQIEVTIVEEMANGALLIEYPIHKGDWRTLWGTEYTREAVFPDDYKVRGFRPRPRRRALRKPSSRQAVH